MVNIYDQQGHFPASFSLKQEFFQLFGQVTAIFQSRQRICCSQLLQFEIKVHQFLLFAFHFIHYCFQLFVCFGRLTGDLFSIALCQQQFLFILPADTHLNQCTFVGAVAFYRIHQDRQGTRLAFQCQKHFVYSAMHFDGRSKVGLEVNP